MIMRKGRKRKGNRHTRGGASWTNNTEFARGLHGNSGGLAVDSLRDLRTISDGLATDLQRFDEGERMVEFPMIDWTVPEIVWDIPEIDWTVPEWVNFDWVRFPETKE